MCRHSSFTSFYYESSLPHFSADRILTKQSVLSNITRPKKEDERSTKLIICQSQHHVPLHYHAFQYPDGAPIAGGIIPPASQRWMLKRRERSLILICRKLYQFNSPDSTDYSRASLFDPHWRDQLVLSAHSGSRGRRMIGRAQLIRM